MWFAICLRPRSYKDFIIIREKIQKCGYSFFSLSKNTATPHDKTLITKLRFSTQKRAKIFFSRGFGGSLSKSPIKTTQHYSSWVKSSTRSKTTKLHKANIKWGSGSQDKEESVGGGGQWMHKYWYGYGYGYNTWIQYYLKSLGCDMLGIHVLIAY